MRIKYIDYVQVQLQAKTHSSSLRLVRVTHMTYRYTDTESESYMLESRHARLVQCYLRFFSYDNIHFIFIFMNHGIQMELTLDDVER